MYVCVYMYVLRNRCGGQRTTEVGTIYFLPPCGAQGLHKRHQA